MNTLPPPVPENLSACIRSARKWTHRLPEEIYGTTVTMRRYNVAAVLVSAVTSVSVWPLIAHSSELWAQVVTSVFTFLAAVLGAVPTALGIRERQSLLIQLSRQMGPVYGDLLDARDELRNGTTTYDKIRPLINTFDQLRAQVVELGIASEDADSETPGPDSAQA
ncbi:hypothetical protein ACFV1L_30275 [Kitasatospora sp. NPDC059646]|uniref:hypothetical protein n=1 Tax=Kitasatospora sp. NPDC059646 TaxID=3346893 RepID=UPI0036AF9EA5